MDVICQNCREPWESYHMRHDAAHEASELTQRRLEWIYTEPLSDKAKREQFEKFAEEMAPLGWKFAGSIYAILRCPCCKEEAENPENPGDVELLAEILGDDEDALIVAQNDYLIGG